MKDFVIDASALVLSLVGKTAAADALRQRLPQMRRHAPHLIDAEVGNVLRRHERAGLISAREAETALRMLDALVDNRYPHAGMLARRAWEMRHHVSFYDELYAALAGHLDIPLLTADARLDRAAGLACRVEVVG
ncbi:MULTISPECIES: type II toxin-antitoxin system VapC family toxin [Mycobacterium]|uniref:Ribonuclease VapC n=1 Tax=Mycobacterium kiyosense TaxID=2871094 RepID=A0A9P3UTA8_9MYCO|nr:MULTISPECIES: type II toxin-antitoxin system VapC family toxin [Mycobacterium]BDB43421.1 ribonuclease VapC [Mycobacterium kiyosense]BDE13412.1 ribonuclease VapC [Mycobacterium sp. 20KCMC460]GLB86025.1 ribonuclease VapC [Mycobacterium kiyosense]GLB88345.1 ribonuclease VapC [Mycobacterium kiyosense]GLB94730.1 ribonuclease VapC [Mycobacterium kiyosense]